MTQARGPGLLRLVGEAVTFRVSLGVTAFDSAEAKVKRAMARSNAGIVIAVTNDKLATAAPYRVAAPDAIRHLAAERTAPSPILADF